MLSRLNNLKNYNLKYFLSIAKFILRTEPNQYVSHACYFRSVTTVSVVVVVIMVMTMMVVVVMVLVVIILYI